MTWAQLHSTAGLIPLLLLAAAGCSGSRHDSARLVPAPSSVTLPTPPRASAQPGWHVTRQSRWPLGGELVRRGAGDFWLRHDACGVARLSAQGPVSEVAPPDPARCTTAIVASDDRLAYATGASSDAYAWTLVDVVTASRRALLDPRLLVAGKRVLTRSRDLGRLSLLPDGAEPGWTLPVHPLLHAVLAGDEPQTVVAGGETETLDVIDKPAPDEPSRLRRVALRSGKVEMERVFNSASALGSVDGASREALLFLGRDRAIRLYEVREPDRPRWVRSPRCNPEHASFARSLVVVDTTCEQGKHEVYALRPEDGAVVWSSRIDAEKLSLFDDEKAIVWARDNLIAEVDPDTGRERWTWALERTPRSVVRISSDEWLASGVSAGTELLRIDRTRTSTPVRVSGRARVDGFTTHEGIEITVAPHWSTTTRADGSFEVDIPVHGSFELWAQAPLDARMNAVTAKARAAGASAISTPHTIYPLDTEQDRTEGLEINLDPVPEYNPD